MKQTKKKEQLCAQSVRVCAYARVIASVIHCAQLEFETKREQTNMSNKREKKISNGHKLEIVCFLFLQIVQLEFQMHLHVPRSLRVQILFCKN